jgi:hypothetical protein
MNKPWPVSAEDQERIVALYSAGKSSLQIAALLGIGKARVLNVVRAHGLYVRPRGGTAKRPGVAASPGPSSSFTEQENASSHDDD